MSFSLTHLLILLVIVMICFGAGKLPSMMGDVAKGIRSFKKGLKDEDGDSVAAAPPAQNPQPMRTIESEPERDRPVVPTRQDETVQR